MDSRDIFFVPLSTGSLISTSSGNLQVSLLTRGCIMYMRQGTRPVFFNEFYAQNTCISHMNIYTLTRENQELVKAKFTSVISC